MVICVISGRIVVITAGIRFLVEKALTATKFNLHSQKRNPVQTDILNIKRARSN